MSERELIEFTPEQCFDRCESGIVRSGDRGLVELELLEIGLSDRVKTGESVRSFDRARVDDE